MKQEMEIICVGNELLIGKTLNTNAHWLAKKATSLGMTVKRITIVGDYVEEIATVTQEALRRKPKFIITTGGLGPTFDDKTLEGIASALDYRLEINEEALEMIRRKYETYFKRKTKKADLTPARVKMAKLPEIAKPLRNAVGTAPGVLMNVEKTVLIMLPGVPPEMEAIFKESVAPMLRGEGRENVFVEKSVFTEGIAESTLAPLIDRAMQGSSDVYIKSHVYTDSTPVCEGRKSQMELHFSTRAKNARTGKTCLEKAIQQLSRLIEQNGGKIKVRNKEQRPDSEYS
jgi:molybdenum cofactor synthesis domain-containing protein